ncbi:hypothetical protein BH11MYX2_BH11MYX2_24790 [soil metagenome]
MLACALTACGRVAFDRVSEGDAGGDGAITSCTAGDRHTLYNNHCYFSFDAVTGHAPAAQRCADEGAHLATISESAEQAAVLSLYAGDVNQWLGLSDQAVEGTFVWTDGTPLGFTAWSSGEPNDDLGREDCVEMWRAGQWNDRLCSDNLHFVCERDPVQSVAPCAEGNWGPGAPTEDVNENCLEWHTNGWNDTPCSDPDSYACELR